MNEVLVATFDTEDATARAISALASAGVPRTSIRRYRRDEYDASTGMAGSGTTATGAPAETRPHHSKGGFWAWLLGEESGTADHQSEYDSHYDSYRNAIEAGRTVVAVTVNQAEADRVLDLLRAQSPVYVEDSGPTNATGTEVPTSTTATPVAPTAAQPSVAKPSAAVKPDTHHTPEGRTEEVIPLAEEHVDLGKRRVQSGSTEIRRYVTERPIERQVNLKDEHVEVEHRKPARGTATPGSDAFQERTIEVHDAREEPVVERRAEVGEEVVVRKEVRERPETVRTTERKEEIDVRQENKA